MKHGHESVLLTEAVEALMVSKDATIVDATLGGAGHFGKLLELLGEDGTLIGIDADAAALARAREVARDARPRVELVEDNFRNLSRILPSVGVTEIDGALFDLGWSGYQLSGGRGFSFRIDEPLIMTYAGSGMTAADVVNQADEIMLADIIFTLGEERFARRIASEIVAARKQERILTTKALSDVIEGAVPSWYSSRRIHPATKTFQALRMYVNDELGALREGLSAALTALSPGGRVAVITFHSIEDRVVKTMLRDAAHEGKGTLVTKKPILPSFAEVIENPRARSAKLRIFERAPASVSSTYAYA